MMKTIVLSGRPACVVCWLYHAGEWYEAETREKGTEPCLGSPSI
jgi:hypothetical protein